MRSSKTSLLSFFLFTFGISWAFWITAILLGGKSSEPPTAVFYMLGGCVPSLVAIYLVYRSPNKADRAELWQRLSLRSAGAPALLAALLIPAASAAAALALNAALGGPAPEFSVLPALMANPVEWIPLVISVLIAGPLSEELGWRGYALDRLLPGLGRWGASLLLGLAWWAWHLPLFWINGTTHHGWGVATLDFWLFLVMVLSLSLLMTLLVCASRRSILTAVMLHFSFNLTMTLTFPLNTTLRVYLTAFLLAGALVTGLALRSGQPQTAPAQG